MTIYHVDTVNLSKDERIALYESLDGASFITQYVPSSPLVIEVHWDLKESISSVPLMNRCKCIDVTNQL